MSNRGLITVDIKSFVAQPKSQGQTYANAHLIWFCIGALEAGFGVSILYDDYDPFHPKKSKPWAKKQARDRVFQAIKDYESLRSYPSVNPRSLLKKLRSIVEYQRGFRKKHLVTDTTDNQDRTPQRIDPLDLTTIVVSPQSQRNKDYNAFRLMLNSDALYIPTSEINGFNFFRDFTTNAPQMVKIRQSIETSAKLQIAKIFTLARDKQTVEFSLDGLGADLLDGLRENPDIVDFLEDTSENLIEFACTETPPKKTSYEDQLLRSYFCALVRAERCPSQGLAHMEDATYLEHELSSYEKGDLAAAAVRSEMAALKPLLTPQKP